MQGIEIAFIARAKVFSPNNVSNDALILRRTAEQLAEDFPHITFMDEDELDEGMLQQPVIVHMCRHPRTIQLLKRLENDGRLVINSGYGIGNCGREEMTQILEANHIPCPDTLIVQTDAPDIASTLAQADMEACWIKRGDGYSVLKEDVCLVHNAEEANAVLANYQARGIEKAVISRHLAGDLVKFYGVKDAPFFHTLYPNDSGRSKFGQEEANGPSHHYPFDLHRLYTLCQSAAHSMNVAVFGGDCIISKDGDIRLIDFNDWPSFSPCREEGAAAIAAYISAQINHHFTA